MPIYGNLVGCIPADSSCIELDTTLTQPGKAADAKVVGDALDTKQPKGSYATKEEIPTKTSDLINDSGYLTSYTETDPTVPAWAKQPNKPSYTASEVGAVPSSRTVNGKVLSENITLSASDVGADVSGAANTALTNAKAYTDSEITEWVGDKKVSEQITTAVEAIDSLPEVTTNDDGKILCVMNGAWQADSLDKVNSGGNSDNSNVTLSVSGWDNENKQTVNVSGVTATSTIIVGGDLGSEPHYTDCEVYCSGQGNGTLTFKCILPPSEDLVANVAIL